MRVTKPVSITRCRFDRPGWISYFSRSNQLTVPSMTRKSEAASEPASFETAIEELESIVRAMEDGKLPLDSALERYQRGVDLVRHCQSALNAAEQKVQILEDGLLRDFPADASARGDD